MWVSRTTKSSSVALGTTPLQSLCSLTKHMSPEMVPAPADSNYMSVVLRASEGTTVVMKQSPMWDQQNVCTGWWYMHQQASRSPLRCGSLHWSTRVNHFSIIPRHAHCNQCYRWMCPCALGSYMWTDEHHHVRTPLQSFCLKNLMRTLGLEMARWMVVSAPWWRGLYLGHSFLNRNFFCGNKKIINFTPSWDEGSCTLKGNLASKIEIWNHFIFKCNVNSCQIRLNNFIYEPNTLPCVYYITQCY